MHTVVVVPLGGEVKLHGPVPLGVAPCQVGQQRPLILPHLLFRHGFSRQAAPDHAIQFLRAGRGVPQVVQAVVGHLAAVLCEEVHPVIQGGQQAPPSVDVHPCGGGEPGQIVWEVLLFHVNRLVRPECGEHFGFQGMVGSQPLVPFQGVRRIISGAQKGHIGFTQDLTHTQAPADDGAAVLPHLAGVGRRQVSRVTEVAPQLQMAPVVQGIAHRLLHGAGPSLKLLIIPGIAGDIPFVHTIGPHQPPFVMVPLQPELGQVVEDPVLRDLPRAHVAVVVQYGQTFRHLMV